MGPNLSIPGQHGNVQDKGNYQGQQQANQPALFGKSQLKNDLGPVYAVPSFPQHNTGNGHWQQQDTHPAPYGQNQFKNNLGPVYAVPSRYEQLRACYGK